MITNNEKYVLEMKSITKEFPGVKALDNVDFQLKAGEIHSILGENGAGKSTLIKVLGGIHKQNAGEILIEGEKVTIDSVQDAQRLGISIIHQELVLVPHLSVAENVFLGREPKKGISIDFKKMVKDTEALLEEFELDIKPTKKVGKLSIANQQMVEIIKAISFNAKILVMDEPTSSISDTEVERLFEIMRTLKKQGVGIIYISHRMSELDMVCDRVSVLRDGQYIDTVKISETNRDQLVAMMVGRDLSNTFQRKNAPKEKIVFEAKEFTDTDLLEKISFNVKAGEIVGFAGLIGAGRSELMETIFGLRGDYSGEIYLNGKELNIKNPQDAIDNKIGLVPEDRKNSALFPDKSTKFNLSINVLDEFIQNLKEDSSVENGIVEEYIKSLNIKTPSMSYPINKLSGGNQQKTIIARWLATQPKLLILDEPTRGVDVGAKREIYEIIDRLTEYDISIIIVSSELPEIISVCDRTYVMSEGKITGELAKDEMTQDNIMQFATANL